MDILKNRKIIVKDALDAIRINLCKQSVDSAQFKEINIIVDNLRKKMSKMRYCWYNLHKDKQDGCKLEIQRAFNECFDLMDTIDLAGVIDIQKFNRSRARLGDLLLAVLQERPIEVFEKDADNFFKILKFIKKPGDIRKFLLNTTLLTDYEKEVYRTIGQDTGFASKILKRNLSSINKTRHRIHGKVEAIESSDPMKILKVFYFKYFTGLRKFNIDSFEELLLISDKQFENNRAHRRVVLWKFVKELKYLMEQEKFSFNDNSCK